uniref:Uncharacterized protein n=1 Tax=Rhizophora mucronata TaxID=61149 RepID=A0A2P2Q2P2_RHIMU
MVASLRKLHQAIPSNFSFMERRLDHSEWRAASDIGKALLLGSGDEP